MCVIKSDDKSIGLFIFRQILLKLIQVSDDDDTLDKYLIDLRRDNLYNFSTWKLQV